YGASAEAGKRSISAAPAGAVAHLRLDEAAALEDGRPALLRRMAGQHVGGVVLGAVLGLVAEPVGVGVVPPAALVVGGAVDDLEAEVGAFDADAHEVGEVARADPDAEAAAVDGPHRHVADADRHHALDAVLVVIQAAQGLAEGLAD